MHDVNETHDTNEGLGQLSLQRALVEIRNEFERRGSVSDCNSLTKFTIFLARARVGAARFIPARYLTR